MANETDLSTPAYDPAVAASQTRATPMPQSSDAKPTAGGPRPIESTESLDSLKIMPGDSLQLQPMIEGQTERYSVRVIGMMKGKSVLVTAPMIEGKLIFIREAQPFLIRAFSGQNVCAFKSKVLKAQHTPFPYLHLAYPDAVQVMRIRKAMRAPVQLIAALNDKEGGRSIGAGRLVDISVGGGRIQVARNVTLGVDVYISFKVVLGDHEEYIATHAVVRSSVDEDDDQGKPVRAVEIGRAHV
jgi:c-di-GMP-binding flagellar brake protein YcgR